MYKGRLWDFESFLAVLTETAWLCSGTLQMYFELLPWSSFWLAGRSSLYYKLTVCVSWIYILMTKIMRRRGATLSCHHATLKWNAPVPSPRLSHNVRREQWRTTVRFTTFECMQFQSIVHCLLPLPTFLFVSSLLRNKSLGPCIAICERHGHFAKRKF